MWKFPDGSSFRESLLIETPTKEIINNQLHYMKLDDEIFFEQGNTEKKKMYCFQPIQCSIC